MKRKKHLKYKDLPKILKIYVDQDFGRELRRIGKDPNPTLRHIIKKIRERDHFHCQLCAEMPELEPLMKRRTMRIKALEAYLSGDVPNSYLKIKYTV